MDDVVVRKLDVNRSEVWRYSGRLVCRQANSLIIEALFNRDDLRFHGIILARGDRFVEKYYNDRWYNIFEIYDRQDGHLKAWYCNVCLPADFTDGQIDCVDLALDLLVFPDGRKLILDEDEFLDLKLDPATRDRARQALTALQHLFVDPASFRLETA